MAIVRYRPDQIPPVSTAEAERIRAIKDEDIDFSDIPPLDEDFWQHAKRFHELYRPRKTQITAKIDADVVAWLKSGGKGYQTRINAILRQAMLQQLAKEE